MVGRLKGGEWQRVVLLDGKNESSDSVIRRCWEEGRREGGKLVKGDPSFLPFLSLKESRLLPLAPLLLLRSRLISLSHAFSR